MIEVKHLDKSFGDLHILKDISTNIEKGEKVVIIGPSGSGKSTFLRCLNRLEQPSGGPEKHYPCTGKAQAYDTGGGRAESR